MSRDSRMSKSEASKDFLMSRLQQSLLLQLRERQKPELEMERALTMPKTSGRKPSWCIDVRREFSVMRSGGKEEGRCCGVKVVRYLG